MHMSQCACSGHANAGAALFCFVDGILFQCLGFDLFDLSMTVLTDLARASSKAACPTPQGQ